jgi:hypothetical protein
MKDRPSLQWEQIQGIESKKYTCGYCGNPLVSVKGWRANGSLNKRNLTTHIYICHYCCQPTYFLDTMGLQIPRSAYGQSVENISDESIESLYEEARRCTAANAFTAAVLCCRKLLMHIAVKKGAKVGATFKQYVDHLATKGYIPPDGEKWVDHIRSKGNEANHEIVLMKPDDAEDLITFIEMLLKFIYEYPKRLDKEQPKIQT